MTNQYDSLFGEGLFFVWESRKLLDGELDQLVAELISLRESGPSGKVYATTDADDGLILCFGTDHKGKSWYIATDGPYGEGPEEDAKSVAFVWNSIPAIILALNELKERRLERHNENDL